MVWAYVSLYVRMFVARANKIEFGYRERYNARIYEFCFTCFKVEYKGSYIFKALPMNLFTRMNYIQKLYTNSLLRILKFDRIQIHKKTTKRIQKLLIE